MVEVHTISLAALHTTSCALTESIWDCCVLVGVDGQGKGCTAWTVMLLLINVIVQARDVVFLYILVLATY